MENLLYKTISQANTDDISYNEVPLQLPSHNDYPSLKAITDTLDYFNIENTTENTPKDVLHQLTQCF